jgi:hypothetical protein
MRSFSLRLALAAALFFACKQTVKKTDDEKAPAPSKVATSTKSSAEQEARTPGAHEHAEEREQKAVVDVIQVLVDGKPASDLTIEKLKSIKTGTVAGASDTGKEGWSLHDVARQLVGAKARVIAVSASKTKRLELEPAKWSDPKRVPMLRVNRRGEFKFQWVIDGTVMPLEPEMRSVHVIELTNL